MQLKRALPQQNCALIGCDADLKGSKHCQLIGFETEGHLSKDTL